MFAKTIQSEKTSVNAATEDMASVSTFTTIGNMPWGNRANDAASETSSRRKRKLKNGRASVVAVACMIVFLGLIAGTALAYLGFRSEKGARVEDFERGALITVSKIRDSFDEYVDTASLIHGRFRHRPQFNALAYEQDPDSYTEEYMEWSDKFRKDFRELYEYVRASGLRFKAMQFDPNITLQERPIAEAEAELYYMDNYPDVTYQGFRGFNGDSTSLLPRWWNQSFYFPIHYMEPIAGNEAAIDLDYYSSESRIRAVEALFETKKPSLTDRLSLVKKAGSVSRCISGHGGFAGVQGPSFGVVLMHPGVKLSQDNDSSWPRDFSSIVLCMPDLMKRATDHLDRKISVYIHDLSHPTYDEPVFMGAVQLDQNETAYQEEDAYVMSLREEIPLHELNCAAEDPCHQQTIDIANRRWTITVVDEHGYNKYQLLYVILVGLVVFVAFFCLAIWVLATDRKNRSYAALKAQAASERNALVLENANKAAQTERELNDFLAHEVRNPLAAAMAATTFLRTQLERRSQSTKGVRAHFDDSGEIEGLVSDTAAKDISGRDDSIKSLASPRLVQAREDVEVVDNSLRFINDLLRTMLDMHRATSGNLQVKLAPVDLLRDVLEPVAGMLHRGEGNIGRGKGDEKVQITVDCPEDIVVTTDVLRLKQVILNLGRNSVKFINEGFIRLRAEVVEVECSDDPIRFRDEFVRENSNMDIECGDGMDKTVRIYVEDSGSGIPIEKRERLFAKYQESLDLLSQGTGIGLHLCKNLVQLMGGRISLDNDYDSGIPGCPGARFVVDLQAAPSDTYNYDISSSIDYDRDVSYRVNFVDETSSQNEGKLFDSLTSAEASETDTPELPNSLKVLFVDDDRVLRKLFARTIKMVAPGWTIREAANGEAAILLADEEDFDLIFCDMYMASVEKQLLGTETVAELRSKGLSCRICGLSANDKEREFLDAGADAFLFKPIPCEANALRSTLHRVLND